MTGAVGRFLQKFVSLVAYRADDNDTVKSFFFLPTIISSVSGTNGGGAPTAGMSDEISETVKGLEASQRSTYDLDIVDGSRLHT